MVIKSLIKYPLFLLAFAPLIVANGVFFPYINGKVLFIRSVLTLVLFLLSVNLFDRVFRNGIYERFKNLLKNKIFLSVLVYFTFFIISTFLAADKITAFWGDV